MSERAAELSELCRSCGICCDGTMFARVPLEPEDSPSPTLVTRLRVLDGSFPQPCAAHGPTGCEAYAERPLRCRGYSCALYRAHRDDGGPLAPRLDRVRRVRELAEGLRRERDRARKASEMAESSWLFDSVAELLDGAKENLPAKLLLDVAELGMRLQRDFGWKPRPPGP